MQMALRADDLQRDKPDVIQNYDETPLEAERRDLTGEIATDPAFTEIAQYLTWAKDLDFNPAEPEIMKRAITAGRAAWELAGQRESLEEVIAAVVNRSGVTHPDLVYYIRMGNLIKIGTTTNLRHRLDTLSGQGVLAVEPGGRKRESSRHAQFACARSHREWFHPASELMDHILRLRSSLEEVAEESVDAWIARELLDRKDWRPREVEGRGRRSQANQRNGYASKGLVTATDAARVAGVTVASINSWRSRGRLQSAKNGNTGVHLYRLSDVMAARRRRRPQAATSMSRPESSIFGVQQLRNLLGSP